MLGHRRTMKSEQHNPGICMRVPGATCENLCRAVSEIPGVIVTRRRQPFWTISDGSAEFTLRDQGFTIEPDEWDGVYWVMSQDWQKHETEMLEIQAAVEKITIPRVRAVDYLCLVAVIGIAAGLHSAFPDQTWVWFISVPTIVTGAGCGWWWQRRADRA